MHTYCIVPKTTIMYQNRTLLFIQITLLCSHSFHYLVTQSQIYLLGLGLYYCCIWNKLLCLLSIVFGLWFLSFSNWSSPTCIRFSLVMRAASENFLEIVALMISSVSPVLPVFLCFFFMKYLLPLFQWGSEVGRQFFKLLFYSVGIENPLWFIVTKDHTNKFD